MVTGTSHMSKARQARTPASTTEPGFENRNRQQVVRPTGLRGTDHNARVYEIVCRDCGYRYGANGTDIHDRKCPKCQGGKPGLPTEPRLESAPIEPWTVADAKARFSEVLEKARTEGPQVITRNGKKAAVVVGIDEWEKKTKRQGTLAEFFHNSPWRGADIDLERSPEKMREIEF